MWLPAQYTTWVTHYLASKREMLGEGPSRPEWKEGWCGMWEPWIPALGTSLSLHRPAALSHVSSFLSPRPKPHQLRELNKAVPKASSVCVSEDPHCA